MELSIGKETRHALLYTLRMAVASAIGLYTSSEVLNALGVSDYGTYCVVAGLVWLFAFLNSSVCDATTRFITFSLGSGASDSLRHTFSTAFWLHAGVALAVAALAESAGTWYLNHHMQLDPAILHDANIAFQLILASLIVGFLRIPFSSIIFAQERFRVYSWIEIANSVLGLLILIPLRHADSALLVLYSSLLLGVSVATTAAYVVYSLATIPESRISFSLHKTSLRCMVTFGSYDAYGNACVTVKSHASPLVVNMFFDVAVNSSVALGATFSSAVWSLVSGLSEVYMPRITKSYASGDIEEMGQAMCRAVGLSALGFGMLLLPCMILMPEILEAWLGDVPEYVVEFSQLALLSALVSSVVTITNTAIHSTGKIRRLSFINGSMYLLCPLLAWIAFSMGCGAVAIGAIEFGVMTLILVNGCMILKKEIPDLDISRYLRAIARSVLPLLLLAIILYLI